MSEDERRVRDIHLRLLQLPSLHELADALRSTDPSDEPALLKAGLRYAHREDAVADVLELLADGLGEDQVPKSPMRAVMSPTFSGLLVFRHPSLSVSLGVIELDGVAAAKRSSAAKSVVFSGHVTILRFVRTRGASLRFWTSPTVDVKDSIATAGPCADAGQRTFTEGEILVVDGRREAFSFNGLSDSPLVLQIALRTPEAQLAREYDAATLEFVGASALDEAAPRAQLMASVLRAMDEPRAVNLLARYLSDPNFYVRWHMACEMIRLDPAQAAPHVWRLARADPHPEVREAATAAIAQLDLPSVTAEAVV